MIITRVDNLSKVDLWRLSIEPTEPLDYGPIIEVSDLYDLIFRAASRTFKSLSAQFDRKVYPWEKVCVEACRELADNLPTYFEKEYVWFDGSDNEDSHQFLVINYEENTYLIDPTYQQYLTPDERVNAPIVMICPITNREDLIESLLEHSISEDFHHIWVSTVFNQYKKFKNVSLVAI